MQRDDTTWMMMLKDDGKKMRLFREKNKQRKNANFRKILYEIRKPFFFCYFTICYNM